MSRKKLTEQEWGVFVELAGRLGIDIAAVPSSEVRFSTLESIGHQIGRAVAQRTTEKLTLLTAERITDPQPCPTCGRSCVVYQQERSLETIDGPIVLTEPTCRCSTCRRAFFPQRPQLGLDQRTCSPAVVDMIVSANAEHNPSSVDSLQISAEWHPQNGVIDQTKLSA